MPATTSDTTTTTSHKKAPASNGTPKGTGNFNKGGNMKEQGCTLSKADAVKPSLTKSEKSFLFHHGIKPWEDDAHHYLKELKAHYAAQPSSPE